MSILGEIDLLPPDRDIWTPEELERLGMNLYKAAAMLAQAINRGMQLQDILYVRVDVDCPMYKAIRELKEIGVDTAAGEPIEGVMSAVLIANVFQRETGRPATAFVANVGEVALVRMTKKGIFRQNARLVILPSKQEKPS